jgi:glycosyltransferase involved in cell wall biosynthesis
MVAYNAERYIALAIQSVIAQTFTDFELLIIDDGSTDSTRLIIESFADSRIRYICKEHKNPWAGTNRAITEAHGEYIIAVDSDDCIANDYLEKMLATADLHPEIDFFYPAGFVIIDENNESNGARWQYHDFADNRILPHYLFDQGHSPIPYPGSLRRMSMYDKTGGYEEIKNAADFVFLCKNALKIKFKRVSGHSNYYYRSLATSLSHNFKQRDETTARILNEMISLYEPNVLCPQITDISNPDSARHAFYKYITETFDKHANGYHMVRHGEFFRKYGDCYKAELSKLNSCGNNELQMA